MSAHRHATRDATASIAPPAACAHSRGVRRRGSVAATTKPSTVPAATHTSGIEQRAPAVIVAQHGRSTDIGSASAPRPTARPPSAPRHISAPRQPTTTHTAKSGASHHAAGKLVSPSAASAATRPVTSAARSTPSRSIAAS